MREYCVIDTLSYRSESREMSLSAVCLLLGLALQAGGVVLLIQRITPRSHDDKSRARTSQGRRRHRLEQPRSVRVPAMSLRQGLGLMLVVGAVLLYTAAILLDGHAEGIQTYSLPF